MAEALSSAGIGDNSLSQAAYLEFLDRYSDADERVARAVADRKDLRAKIKAAGIPLPSFDRTRRDLEKSGAVREHEETWYRRMMGWSKKPVGFQASMDLDTADPTTIAFNAHELHTIDSEGFEAGRTARRRESNSYTPGTEAHQRWDNAWLRGQAENAAKLASTPAQADAARAAANGAANGAAEGETAPKRRGRPPGSRNRPKTATEAEGAEPASVH